MTERGGPLAALGRRTATVFLVAGGLMVVFAANTYLKTFMGTSYPVVQGIIAPIGFLVGVIGLLGLYVRVADSAPAMLRVAAALAAFAAVSWVVIIASSAILQGEPGGPLAIVPLLTIVSMTLAFTLFGAATLYTGVYSPVVGVLLLLEGVMFLLVIAGIPGFIIDLGHVLAYLGLGTTLWARKPSAEAATTTAETTP